jgi:hypothetical protein
MRGAVLGPAVGLDLDQPSPEDLALDLTHQELAENVARHLQGVAIEEFGTQQPSIRMLSWAGHRCNIGRPITQQKEPEHGDRHYDPTR